MEVENALLIETYCSHVTSLLLKIQSHQEEISQLGNRNKQIVITQQQTNHSKGRRRIQKKLGFSQMILKKQLHPEQKILSIKHRLQRENQEFKNKNKTLNQLYLYLPASPESEQIRRPRRTHLPPTRLMYAAPGNSANYFVNSVFPQQPFGNAQGQFPVTPPVFIHPMFIPGGHRMLPIRPIYCT